MSVSGCLCNCINMLVLCYNGAAWIFPIRSVNGAWALLVVCRGGCPKSGDAEEFGAEWGRATGRHGTHSGSLPPRSSPFPRFCVPILPTICPEQQYSSTLQMNPLVLFNMLLVLSSKISLYLKRGFDKCSLGSKTISPVFNANPVLKIAEALSYSFLIVNGLIDLICLALYTS